MFKLHLKTAWRNLTRQHIYGWINIGGLAVGMSAAILVFLWVQNELTFDGYHKQANQIFRITSDITVDKNSTWTWPTSPYLLGEKARQQLPEVIGICRLKPMSYNPLFVNMGGQFFKEDHCAYVDDGWFKFFSYDFLEGTAEMFNQHVYSMALSASKARQYFGNQSALGKIIRIDTVNYQVQAVLADPPTNSSFTFDVLMPLRAFQARPDMKRNDEEWGNYNYNTFLKLSAAANPEAIAKKLTAIIDSNSQKSNAKERLIALKNIHFESDLQESNAGSGDRKTVYIFSILGCIILVVACINYINLTTARAALRAKEVSIKKIIGAERQQLAWQFITESCLFSMLAFVCTIVIMLVALPFFNQLTEKEFTLSPTSIGLWVITGCSLLLVVLITGIYPALLLSSFRPLNVLRGSSILQLKDTLLRKGLVVLQFTVSLILIVGTIIVYRQLKFIEAQSDSYNRSQLMSFSIPYRIISKYSSGQRISLINTMKNELLNNKEIGEVALMTQPSIVNMNGESSGNADWDGRDKNFNPGIAYMGGDASFKKMLNLQMIYGRWFNSDGGGDLHNFVLNETAVNQFNIHKPVIGQRFAARGDTGVIVGVVKDFYYKSMHEKIGPVVLQAGSDYSDTYLLRAAARNIGQTQQAAAKVWKKIFPAQPFRYRFLDEEFEKLYRADQRTGTLIWCFSVVAICLSCLGLFGLAAFAAQRRNKELGIRKLLGAEVFQIVDLLCREYVYMIVIAMLIATPIAIILANKWLQNFAYHVTLDPMVFVIAAGITIGIALLTVSFQAFKSALSNPVNSLRAD